MAEITLVAEPGRLTGSAASRRLRHAGRVPAVVYGHGVEPTSVSVDGRELRHALSGEAGLNQLLSVKVGGTSHLALARALQRHPVRHTLLHVDFLVVRRDEVIGADVPIVLVGEAKAVEQDRGVIEQPIQTLSIRALPGNIPNAIQIDISELTVGGSVRVGDLELPSGVTTDVDPEEPVVTASASTVAAELALEEAEVEAAAAAGEGGEGAGASVEGAPAESGEASEER
jgi:large subunit ribosomal protein L25